MRIKYPFYMISIMMTFFVVYSAQALQKNINISVNVAPSLEMSNHDGSTLPSALTMNYIPSTHRLSSVIHPTMISGNDVAQGIKIKLLNEPKLVSTQDAAKQVKLNVKLGDNNVTTADTFISKADLTSAHHTTAFGQSVASNLTISQAPDTTINKQEVYQGTVNLVLAMAP